MARDRIPAPEIYQASARREGLPKLEARDEADLRWYFREARAAVGGLAAQGYDPGIDHDVGSDDQIARAFARVPLAKRASRVEAARDRLLLVPDGSTSWVTLSLVYGLPRRDDPWQDFAREPELAPLVSRAPSLLAVVSGMGLDLGRAAVRAWEIAHRSKTPPKKDPALVLATLREIRSMYTTAANAYREAQRALLAVARDRKADEARRDVGDLGPASERLLAASAERSDAETAARALRLLARGTRSRAILIDLEREPE